MKNLNHFIKILLEFNFPLKALYTKRYDQEDRKRKGMCTDRVILFFQYFHFQSKQGPSIYE